MLHRPDLRDCHHFASVERAAVEQDILDAAFVELAGTALTESRRGGGGRRSLELVDVGLGFGEDAIDVELYAGALTAAVVRHKNVLPDAGLQQVLGGADLEGVVGPFADDVKAEVLTGLEEVPTLSGLSVIHAGDDGAVAFHFSGANPGADAEGFLRVEVAQLANDEIGALLESGGGAEFTVGLPDDWFAVCGCTCGQSLAFV